MSTTYSPVLRCEVAHVMVRVDRPISECALENGCTPGCQCPLIGSFAQSHANYRTPGAWGAIKR